MQPRNVLTGSQYPSTQQLHLLPCFIALFYPGMAWPAVMNVRRDREAAQIFLLEKEKDVAEKRSGEQMASPVCLLCLKNTEGEAPSQTSQVHGPAVISSLPHLPPNPDTSRFNASFKTVARCSVTHCSTADRKPLLVLAQLTSQLHSHSPNCEIKCTMNIFKILL